MSADNEDSLRQRILDETAFVDRHDLRRKDEDKPCIWCGLIVVALLLGSGGMVIYTMGEIIVGVIRHAG